MDDKNNLIEPIESLKFRIVGCAINVAKILGTGYLEQVYQKALAVELSLHKISFKREEPLKVKYKGVLVGDYKADFIVEDRLILELKSVSSITAAHELQLVNYLTATGIDEGIILNFGEFPIGKRTKTRTYNKVKGKNNSDNI